MCECTVCMNVCMCVCIYIVWVCIIFWKKIAYCNKVNFSKALLSVNDGIDEYFYKHVFKNLSYLCFQLSYIVFLAILSGILLTQLRPGPPTIAEIIVIVWVFTLTVEEIRQVSRSVIHSHVEYLTLMLLVANLMKNDAKNLKNDWNPGIWVYGSSSENNHWKLTYEYQHDRV